MTKVFDRQINHVACDAGTLEGISCLSCGQSGLSGLFAVKGVPVHQNVLYANRKEAENCKRGDLNIALCNRCGFISNYAFDPALLTYSQDYENSQCVSNVFQEYMNSIAQRLIERYDLKGKTVLEIGCGKGDFLKTICRMGNNRGIGFDKTYEGSSVTADLNVQFIEDYYSQSYSHYQGDLVCCRHVLEHIDNPLSFLQMVRETIGNNLNTVLYFEVPCARWIMDNLVFWDLFYEHCNYFTDVSLTNLFQSAGFDVLSVTNNFQGQYLWLEAKPRDAANKAAPPPIELVKLTTLSESVEKFRSRAKERMGSVSELLRNKISAGKRLVLWGAGAKGGTILNTLRLSSSDIPLVVDINPGKQNMHIPVTAQKVVAPDELLQFKPDCIVIMNPNYADEIRSTVETLGLDCELVIL